jgi:hypothetical protein
MDKLSGPLTDGTVKVVNWGPMRPRLLVLIGALVCASAAAGCGPSPISRPASLAVHISGTPTPKPSSTTSKQRPTQANRGVIGLALSGIGSSLKPPTSPTYRPYSSNCHLLIDAGFSGKCVLVQAPSGTVAGVVEVESADSKPPKGRVVTSAHGPGVEERDLVWHRQGARWELALVHVFQNPGLASLVWGDDVERDHDPKLVLVTPSARVGFGNELDLVEGSGDVTLYRFLGQGFANVPAPGGLVTYVPGWTERQGPAAEYDQTLIGYVQGSWRVLSEQYVPNKAALQQHRAAFWDDEAVPAG